MEKQRVRRTGNRILVGPDDGRRLPVLDIVHKLGAGVSGVSLTVDEWGLEAGQMIPPHTHAREDECSFVLEGELTCDVGGEVVVAPAGSYVVKPRGVYHAFYNAGPGTVRVMEILTPGEEFEGYFDEYEQIASSALGEEAHRRARAELGARYGISWHDELIPEVRAGFGIGAEGGRDGRSTSTRARLEGSDVARTAAQGNEAVVRRYVEEVWNRHDLDVIDELVSPGYVNHAASTEEYRRGGARRIWEWVLSVFPDHRFDVDDVAADGQTVAVRGTMVGTHEGELMGLAPTGKRVAARQSHWFRVAEGKIAEHWAVRDDLGMVRQLGVTDVPD